MLKWHKRAGLDRRDVEGNLSRGPGKLSPVQKAESGPGRGAWTGGSRSMRRLAIHNTAPASALEGKRGFFFERPA
jgi:hypothetical protein